MHKLPEEILNYLGSLYTNEGLFDPIEEQVLPNKYGNSFFALSCVLLYNKNKNPKWKKFAERAIRIELNNTNNRFNINDMFRWEFKNYALLNIYDLFTDIASELKVDLKIRLINMQNMGSFKTNWICMRGLNYLLRFKLFGDPGDLRHAEKEINRVLQRQTSDGLFYDDYESNSFQYHSYILALLLQYYKLKPSERLKVALVNGLKFIKVITAPNGDCNYFGRGQEQVFGYISAIYALNEANNLIDNKGEYLAYASLIFSYISPYLAKMNIIGNEDQDARVGWYKYNYLTDYLAFSSAYLLMINNEFKTKDKISKLDYECFLSDSNLFVKRTAEYFLCICAGNKSISEMPGLVYIYPNIVPCNGGPPVNILDGPDYGHNYLGLGPAPNPLLYSEGKFVRDNDKLILIFNLKKCKVICSWFFGKNLVYKHEIFPFNKIKVSPLHYASWKKLDSTALCILKGKVFTPQGIVNEYEANLMQIDNNLSVTVSLFKGKKEPKKVITSISFKSNRHRYELQKILYFIGLSLDKIIRNPKD